MSLESALALIDSVRDYKVLFVGETIIDEYQFTSPMAKPSKENIISVRLEKTEIFKGGVIAAARHAESFCNVHVVTIKKHIRKTRFVDEHYTRKLFEVQSIEDDNDEPVLAEALNEYDVAVVNDYGHGMFPAEVVTGLCESGVFLAVAAQTNAANAGFNLITKYPRADYICIDEPEARLAASDRYGHIEDVLHKLAHGRCEKFIITSGRNGAYGYQPGRFVHCNAFTHNIVDTIGAGDAFYAVTAPMAKMGNIEDLLMIGNAAGAMKTQIVGHREPVTKDALITYLKEHGTGESNQT